MDLVGDPRARVLGASKERPAGPKGLFTRIQLAAINDSPMPAAGLDFMDFLVIPGRGCWGSLRSDLLALKNLYSIPAGCYHRFIDAGAWLGFRGYHGLR